MKHSVLLSSFAAATILTSGLSAAKKKKPEAAPATAATSVAAKAPAMVAMSADQKVLHALNRLTFGARPGDVEQVKQMGLEKWIETQLHPEQIAENPLLDSKLQPLDTLRMSSAEMLVKYPGQQH